MTKVKKNDFPQLLSNFFTKYLRQERNCSENTLDSYKVCLKLLINFLQQNKGISQNKISIESLGKQTILEFLSYLEDGRNCSIRTRNQRLASIKSFFKYIGMENMEYYQISNQIKQIREKQNVKKSIDFLTKEEIKILLDEAYNSGRKGHRNYLMLHLLYESGCRVSELLVLTSTSFQFKKDENLVRLLGKGRKQRSVPLNNDVSVAILSFIQKNKLNNVNYSDIPIFHNSKKESLTRASVFIIIKKIVENARLKNEDKFKMAVGCHTFRHSKATHLLKSGVDLYKIKDLLGHESITTTEVYAKNDYEDVKEALERTYDDSFSDEKKLWDNNQNLIDWLDDF